MKRILFNHYFPDRLTKVILSLLGSAISLVPGLGIALGAGGAFISPVCIRNFSVLRAAPFNATLPEIAQFAQLNSPPANVRMSGLMMHSVQLRPSRGWVPPSNLDFVRVSPGNGGTTGSAPPTWNGVWKLAAACTVVDAWIPYSMNPQQSPTINDPNAMAFLDIQKPPNRKQSNCVTWHWHYGTPPPKQPEKPKKSGTVKSL